MLTETSRTTVVLFPVDEEHARENGPLFTGSIKLDGESVPYVINVTKLQTTDMRLYHYVLRSSYFASLASASHYLDNHEPFIQ